MSLRRSLLAAFTLVSVAACAAPTAPAPRTLTPDMTRDLIQGDTLSDSVTSRGWPIVHG